MQIRKRGFFVGSALVIGMLAMMAAGSSAPQPAAALAKQLAGKSWQADQGPLVTLWVRRGKLANILINGARSPQPQARAAAMYLLGLYRLARAVPLLASNLKFRYIFRIGMLPVRGSSPCPVVAALIRIGSPAIPAMVKHLRTTADAKVAGCSAWVIRKIEGPELGACVIRLALRKASAPLQEARLRVALACVRSKTWRWDYWSPIKLPGNVKWPLPRPKK